VVCGSRACVQFPRLGSSNAVKHVSCSVFGNAYSVFGNACSPRIQKLISVQASQASRQLRQNLEAEGRHVTEFLLTVDQTISPLQQVNEESFGNNVKTLPCWWPTQTGTATSHADATQ
jgi:hypothetical protein